MRHAFAAAGLLALIAGRPAAAHWIPPAEIVRGLGSNPVLREQAGVVRVHQDPKLARLLIVEVERRRWETVPAVDRIRVAEEWWETWHHNVPSGIVAVIDATTGRSLVHYNAEGRANLVTDAPMPAPAPRTPIP